MYTEDYPYLQTKKLLGESCDAVHTTMGHKAKDCWMG